MDRTESEGTPRSNGRRVTKDHLAHLCQSREAWNRILSARVGNLERQNEDLQAENTRLVELARTRPCFTLRTLQAQQRPWVRHNFPGREPYYPLLGAVEELGELAHSHLKMLQKIRGTKAEHLDKAKDAVGDTITYLTDYCSAMGFDIQEIVEETWAQVKKRDWQKDRMKGGEK